MPTPTFDIAACADALGAKANAFQLNALAECDSTNTQLMQLAEEGAASGTVVVADRQTAGRGRRGRVWISSPSNSLTFSLLWRFSAESSAPEALSLAVGLGLQRALVASGVVAAVKWPNDILCKDRKLAGVLIEVQSGDVKSTIIGIGINLHLPPEMPDAIAYNAIALDEMLPQLPTREHLLAVVLTHLSATLHRYQSEGFSTLRDEWQARHAYHGRDVCISGGGEDVDGVCSGVTDHGELLIKTTQGTRLVITGDVSLRPT
ncbi:MAG: biotin--[acetyl-CoA-carboxylase] ligase [Georgfuchsia sp.]